MSWSRILKFFAFLALIFFFMTLVKDPATAAEMVRGLGEVIAAVLTGINEFFTVLLGD